MDLPFFTLDVFTDRTFGGNPLGVVPDATHLPTDLMQSIAREMNLSETIFLGPPETTEGSARIRIFTPARELPFAGHPTVGAAIFLVGRMSRGGGRDEGGYGGVNESGQDGSDADVDLVLEENVGPVPATVSLEGGLPVSAMFTTAVLPEHRSSPHALRDVASMVGLEETDIGGSGPGGVELSVEQVSCGFPYFIVPVRTIDAVRRSRLDLSLWQRMLADAWAHHVYVVCMDAEGDGVDVRARMYAPGSGVPEDPATGSAAAALGGYLSAADGSEEASLWWTIEQGIEMGRPSILRVGADRTGGSTSRIRVAGSAVAVSRGTMTVPDSP